MDREKREREMLSGLPPGGSGVAEQSSIQRLTPQFERRQPSINISLRARCARALNTEL